VDGSDLIGLVELNEPDLNNLNRIISHKLHLKSSLPSKLIIPHQVASVNTAATFISDEGEIVAKQIRQQQKRLSEDEVAQIITAYQGGMSANVLAREYGCNRKAICDHLKKHGVKVTRNRIRSEESVRNIVALYESGIMIEVIADQYDVSQSTINRLLRENGVKIRSRWDYEKQ